MLVDDAARIVAVRDIGVDGGHRTRAVERDNGDEILYRIGLQPGKHVSHAGGFKLEHALSQPLREHIEDAAVVGRYLIHRKIRIMALHHLFGVAYDGQRAQPQKIHLQQSQLLDGGHRELRDYRLVVFEHRHIAVHRFAGDHDAGGVGGGMARHTLELARHLDELVYLRVALARLAQLRRDLERLFQRHLQLHRHQLRHPVHRLIRYCQRPSHVAYRRSRRKRSEGDDLRDMIRAVAPRDIVDDLLPAFVAEVDIEIRHANALRIEEALEQQVVFHRVDAGYADAVGRDAAGAGTASRADGYVLAARKIDEVVDDQIVIDISHLRDDVKLIPQPLFDDAARLVSVSPAHTLIAQPLEVVAVALSLQRVLSFEIGQLYHAELEFDVAALGDLPRDVDGLGIGRERLAHLLLALDIEFVGGKLHIAPVLDGAVGLDADEDVLRAAVLLLGVVAVVGGDERDARLAGYTRYQRQDALLLGDAVVLYLKEEVVLAEDVAVFQRRRLCAVIVGIEQLARHLSREAGRHRDKPLAVFPQQLLVHPRLGIEALGEAAGDQLYQVLIALVVLAEQHKVPASVHAVHLVKAHSCRDIDLAADYRLDAGLFRLLIKIDHAEHDSVVGYRRAVLSDLLYVLKHILDAARAVKKAVFGVKMKMCKAHINSANSSSASIFRLAPDFRLVFYSLRVLSHHFTSLSNTMKLWFPPTERSISPRRSSVSARYSSIEWICST